MRMASGRRIGVRFVLMPSELRAVVRGIFPPEHAPAWRQWYQRIADHMEPKVRRSHDAALRKHIDNLIHGDPTAAAPRGIRGIPFAAPIIGTDPR